MLVDASAGPPTSKAAKVPAGRGGDG